MAEGWLQVGSKKASVGSSSSVLVVARRPLQQQHKASGAGQQGAKAVGLSGSFRGVVVDKTYSNGIRYIVEYSQRPGGPKSKASFLAANVKGLEPSLGDHVNFKLAPGAPKQQQGAAVEVEVVQLRGRVASLKVAKTGEQGFIQYKDGGSAEDKSIFFHGSVVQKGTVLKVGDEVVFVLRTYDKTGQLTARSVRKAPALALATAPARPVAAGGSSSQASTSHAAALARAAVPAPGRPALPVAHPTGSAFSSSSAGPAASAAAALPPALAALSLGPGQEGSEDEGLCIVCWEHPALAVLVPCGHMVCCAHCVRLFGPGAAKSGCPMCREEVLHWVIPK